MAESASNTLLLQAALDYAARGILVYPCQPGSKLPTGKWKDEASCDLGQVIAWWTANPAANIALICGKHSRLVVLDFDVKGGKGGEALAERILGERWRDYWRYVVTPSGGYHIYLLLDERTALWGNPSGLEGCLDIQSEGAYVVAPPSVADGPYLTVHPHLDLVQVCPEEVHRRLLELLPRGRAGAGAGAGGRGGTPGEALPEWAGVQLPRVEVAPWARAAMWEGDWSRWPSRSEGLRALYGHLHELFESRSLVLAALMQCPEVVHVASSGGRAGRAGDPQAAAEWLWADICRCCVEPEEVVERLLERVRTAEHDEWAALVKELGEACAEHVEEPVDRERIWEALMSRGWGLSRKLWRDQLARSDRARREERRVAARARREGPTAEYVFVESVGGFWCLPERVWSTPSAFKLAHQVTDDELRELVGKMARCRKVTYRPHNPWAPGYRAEDTRWHLNTQTVRSELNTWQPSPVQPRMDAEDEDVAPWLELARDVLEIRAGELGHVLDWMAFTLQQPSVKVNHMLVVGGDAGIGKDTFIQPLLDGLGRLNVIEQAGLVGGDFDPPQLATSSLLVLQELWMGQDLRAARAAYNGMKNRLASPPHELVINVKGLKQFAIPNLVNVLAMTNHGDAVQLEQDDRRAYMVWAMGRSRKDTSYWDGLHRWLEDGGSEAVVGWLLRRDVSTFNPKASPPMTDWKERASADSLTTVAEACRAVLDGNAVSVSGDLATADDIAHLVAVKMPGERVTIQAVRRALGELRVLNGRAYLDDNRSKIRIYVLRNEEYWKDKVHTKAAVEYLTRHRNLLG